MYHAPSAPSCRLAAPALDCLWDRASIGGSNTMVDQG
jgi:hypothetical protein